MNNGQNIFLKLISSALSGEKYAISPDEFDNYALQDIAVHNSCLPLLYQGAVNCSLSVTQYWKLASSYSVIDSYRKLTIESEIINILNNNDIRCCILKGSSVAVNYPNPMSRSMGDIDILVDECNYERTALLFVSQKEFLHNEHGFHFGFTYKNVSVEIHKYFTEYSQDNEAVNKIIADAIEHVCVKRYDKFDIPVLSVPYQAISLLTHMARHFKENKFVFRMFCDWVCFVSSVSDECWQREVCPLIENCGLSFFSDALNKAAMLYFEFDLKSKLFTEIDDKICEIMIEEFISVDKSSTTGGVDVNLGTVFSYHGLGGKSILSTYILSVNDITKSKYRLGKYKFFQPVFWIWLPIKYIFNVIIGKRKKLNFRRIGDTVNRRKKLFDVLNLTGYNTEN